MGASRAAALAALLLLGVCGWAAAGQRPSLAVAKWFNNQGGAISITYDAVPRANSPVDALAMELGLVLDYEMVTQRHLEQVPDWVKHDLTELIPEAVPGKIMRRPDAQQVEYGWSLLSRGFGFSGHGHWHVVHDALSYAQAYDSFRLCFEVMQRLGLKPVAYSYPGGGGYEQKTQRALAAAGFLAGRMASLQSGQSPYIVPHAQTRPDNWFELPALAMNSNFRRCPSCINNTEELLPILDAAIDKRAWVIPVYHGIGRTSEQAAFYRWENFQSDMRAIAARDFWVAPMNHVVLYIREREKAEISFKALRENGATSRIEVLLADGLDNDRYDQPLTLIFAPPPEWAGLPLRITQNQRLVDWVLAGDETALISLRPNEQPYILQPWRPPEDNAPRPVSYRSMYESIVSGSAGRPAARSTFDIHVKGNRLAYLKSPCASEDVQARFFLHIFPADAADLPEHRKQHGFVALGFDFLGNGLILDGNCLAVAPLPDYPIARIRTGQWIPGEGQLWQAEISASHLATIVAQS